MRMDTIKKKLTHKYINANATLHVVMQSAVATMEISMEVPQKYKIYIHYDRAMQLLGTFPKGLIFFSRCKCLLTVTTVLLIIHIK